MLAKDAENATSNEFFLKDIKNKKNLHKNNGNNGCVSGYQAVRSVLTTAGTTCVEWRPLRVEFVFTWRTCLLSHTSQHGVAQCLLKNLTLGRKWDGIYGPYFTASGTILYSIVLTRTQTTPQGPMTSAGTTALVEIMTLLRGQNRTWDIRLTFCWYQMMANLLTFRPNSSNERWLKQITI